MPNRLRYIVVLVLLGAVWVDRAPAQAHRMVPLDHWAYEYVKRLQRRGLLLELHPTSLPYTSGELWSALHRLDRHGLRTNEARWADALAAEFSAAGDETPSAAAGGEILPGLQVSTSDRLDPLRPLDRDESTLEVGTMRLFPQAAGRLFLEYGPAVVQAGVRFDLFYRDDPDGLDAANRLIVRNEDSYAGVDTRYVSAYVGRFVRHWAPYGEASLLLSSNAVGFDQIGLRIGGDRLVLRSVLGELDSMTADGRFTGTAGADTVQGSVRRFVAAHRFDWRPSRHFSLSLMESTLFSGENSGWSLKYLNPLNLQAFSVDGRPKNDENNGLLAGMLWAYFRHWTLQGQLTIDDVDLAGESGEPASVALSGSLTYAGFPSLDAGIALTAVSARTYNTHQPEGRYTHLLRGIGTPFNDFVHASAYASYYLDDAPTDITLTPRLDVLLQGETRIHQPYPTGSAGADFILDGTVQRTIRPSIEVRLQGGRSWWARLDAGPAFVVNRNHVEARDGTSLTVTASVLARLDFTERVDLEF